MIVLDTNVVSEAMKPEPAPAVRDWLDEQAAETLYLSSVTVAELLFGIGALPDEQRKRKLAATLDWLLGLFGGRILPFDPLCRPRRCSAQRWQGISHAGRLHRSHCGRPRLRGRHTRRQRFQGGGCPDHRSLDSGSLKTRATPDHGRECHLMLDVIVEDFIEPKAVEC